MYLNVYDFVYTDFDCYYARFGYVDYLADSSREGHIEPCVLYTDCMVCSN